MCCLLLLCRFLPWPEEALTAVSSKFLDSFEALEAGPELRGGLQRMMASVHMQASAEGGASCGGWSASCTRGATKSGKQQLSDVRRGDLRMPTRHHRSPPPAPSTATSTGARHTSRPSPTSPSLPASERWV